MPQGVQKNWAALPRAVQALPAGCVLWCAAVPLCLNSSLGGVLLMGGLWLLCVAWLWILLTQVWRIVFPAEGLRGDKPFLLSWGVGSAAGLAILAAVIYYRQTVYRDDSINYFAKQTLLFGTFGQNGYTGLANLAENLLYADYKMFMNLFLTLPYYFTSRSINAFMLCYALMLFVPMWFAALMLAKRAAAWFPGCRTRALYPLCMAAMVLWPMFWYPASHGMPDAFGLTFAAALLLLCADYRFERLEPGRLCGIFFSAFALILTRRWYLFWLVAFCALYAAAVLIGAARRRVFGRVFVRLGGFGLGSATAVLALLAPTFQSILSTDYADIYGSYYGGGFWTNAAAQANTQGLLWLALCAAGLCAALAKRAARGPALVVTGASVLAMALFTATQSLGDHQSLILAPAYWGLSFCALAAVCAVRRAAVRRAGCMAAAVYFALNFGANLHLHGLSADTPLLADDGIDLTRRTDLDEMRAVTDFVLENCAEGETAYLNIATGAYSGTAFAYSDLSHPRLQSTILWESSVPSTHGFPTGIWSSRYVMVTDIEEGDIVGRINTALRTDTPAAAHYAYVTEFPLEDGITLYCYERTAPPDEAEADYFKTLFADLDARWPELFSQRIDEYISGLSPEAS